jgi:hypothetical protein
MEIRTYRRLARGAVAAATVAAAVVVALPGSASATVVSDCSIRAGGPVVLYYGQGGTGASICLNDWIYSMSGLSFPYNGSGGGTGVWHNAGSGSNSDTVYEALIWSQPGYQGNLMNIPPCCDEGSAPWSLGNVTNQNASLSWTSYP